MAQGDQADFVSRLQLALPLRWFPDDAPVLGGTLSGLAAAWAVVWNNLQFVIAQTRIATATGEWLDAAAQDFFAGRILRYAGQSDAAFRTRILAELLRPRGTRSALQQALQELVGQAPGLFEPTNLRDTGAYGTGSVSRGLFYAVPAAPALAVSASAAGPGGYGNAGLALQVLITTPPPEDGVDISLADVQEGAADVMPCGGIAWIDIVF